MGTVVSINVSTEKGTAKTPVPAARVLDAGIENDAHAGPWHRQVSLLGHEQITGLSRRTGREFRPGQFAENLTVSGIDLGEVRMKDRFRIGEVLLEVTQIGKDCHGGCAIRREVGQCIMPTQGVFTRVLSPGEIRAGDPVEHILMGRLEASPSDVLQNLATTGFQ
jgi:MOSC domain-containing protein YiiM